MTTIEAAILIPLVICMICVLLLGTVEVFQKAKATLVHMHATQKTIVRHPTAIIRNTDLVLSYLERIEKKWEGMQ